MEEKSKSEQLRFDYKSLNPGSGGKKGQKDSRNLVLANILNNTKKDRIEGEKVLEHPLTESFIHLKWRRVDNYLRFQLAVTITLVMLYTLFLSNRNGEGLMSCYGNFSVNMYVLAFLMVPLLLEVIVFEILMRVSIWQSLIALSFIVPAIIFLSIPFPTNRDNSQPYFDDLSAFSGLFAWLYCFSVASISPQLGTNTLIFVKVSRRLLKLILSYLPMLFGFSLAFSLALPQVVAFRDIFLRFNTVFAFLMGETGLPDNFPLETKIINTTPNVTTNSSNPTGYKPQTPSLTLQYTAQILFLLFCFSVSIVVFNILTAFAIKDVQEVLNYAKKTKLLKQAEYITRLEKSFLGRYIDLSISVEVVVKPGLSSVQRCHFKNKLVAKWLKKLKDEEKAL